VLAQALMFLLNTLFGLATLAFLLRFYLQLFGAPFHNPFSQTIVTLTNFAVGPLRRFMPSWGWMDTSTLLLAFLAQLLLHIATLWLNDFPMLVADGQAYAGLAGLAALGMAKASIYIFLYAVLLQAILSWINPHTPLAPVLHSLTNPLLRPLRGLIPLTGSIDFSPIVIFIVAELLLMLVIVPLEHQLMRLF
jgi:YggT family protein